MEPIQNVLTIVLGGGQGSRLYPLTEKRSKPAVPIAGRYRLVDIPISNCFNSGLFRIFVLTQFNSASLNSHIKSTYNFSMFVNSFVDIIAAQQTPNSPGWFQGTADAVRQCMPHIMNHKFKYVLILSGDQLYHMNFKDMLTAHINNDAHLSIATLPVNSKDATEFGILKTNSRNFIDAFIEKPAKEVLGDWKSEVSEQMKSEDRHYLASMGIYIFNKDVLLELLEDESQMDFGKHIIPPAVHTKKLYSYQHEGYWTDIGNVESFFEANIRLTDDVPKFSLFDDARRIFTRARVLPPSKFQNTLFKNVLVSEGCIIEAKEIERSIIGVRSRIGTGTVIKNTYVMGDDFYQTLEEITQDQKRGREIVGIGKNCYIDTAIIDKNSRIGDNVHIQGGKHLADTNNPMYSVKSGIVVIKKGVIIPNNYRIE